MARQIVASLLLALVVPLLAAPTQTQQQQGQAGGPPVECEKPFGEGKLATDASPYNFTVVARQRSSNSADYKKSFKGAPIDIVITFTAAPGAGAIQAFALRAGIPFPVVQWQNAGDANAKIVSCIAPQSVDTLLVKGNVGQRHAAVAVPLLAAWANKKVLPIIYEMAMQGGNGQIYVSAFNGTIAVQETDYELPKQFFQPPTNANNQRGMSGIANMNDPRFQQQGGNQMQGQRGQFNQFPQEQQGRRRRDADAGEEDDEQVDQVQDDDQEDGN